MNKVAIRRIIRPIAAALDFFCEILVGIFVMLIIPIFIHGCIKNETVYHNWLSWGIYVYAAGVLIIALRNIFHQFKWYIKKTPSDMHCTKCHAVVPLTRYGEERYINAPIGLYLETIRFQWIRIKQYFYRITCRPYLQFDCPTCGEDQVVCPYCHEIIPQNIVKCHYDKPTKCPHCGKKIYTPLPLQYSDDLIEL